MRVPAKSGTTSERNFAMAVWFLHATALGVGTGGGEAASALLPPVDSTSSTFHLKHHLKHNILLESLELEPGNLPFEDIFTSEGLDLASKSAGCQQSKEWLSRMSAVHELVAHTYILTLPRPAKVHSAMTAAARLLSVGWPAARTSLFIGADCKKLWGQKLVDQIHKWHGGQTADTSLRSDALAFRVEDSSVDTTGQDIPGAGPEYAKCDMTKPADKVDGLCFSACCAMSHQLVMMHAFHQRTQVRSRPTYYTSISAAALPVARTPCSSFPCPAFHPVHLCLV